ncbi:sugar phosphate nucleotidyltransferase [Atopobacter phocae]|uniref:sugar phosphate nucleotidyltransferase n=1 Tax=Atopobacter phocae TaxID=136492 RepID=UPI0004725C15|nr:sugar phosphate nucleotidyltransferase [Atopobacter phocae]
MTRSNQQEPILLIMAAGMGSRYGGLKQIDRLTDYGETLLHFSMFDAMRAGFKRIVLVIKPEFQEAFDEIFARDTLPFDLQYAYQHMENLPEGLVVPENREKPWGTAHAVWSAKDLIDAPFVVLNADDYYGREAFEMIYRYLTQEQQPKEYAMIGYQITQTLSDNGTVSRGICQVDDAHYLVGIEEQTAIEAVNGEVRYWTDETTYQTIDSDVLVSMNFWAFSKDFMLRIEEGFVDFFEQKVKNNPLKAEYFLPTVVEDELNQGVRVKVLPTDTKWFGVTYKEDREQVIHQINRLKATGHYPERLFQQ